MKLLFLITAVTAVQIPLLWSLSDKLETPDFEALNSPISLENYKTQCVVRVLATNLTLLRLKYNVWNAQPAAGKIDIQLETKEYLQLAAEEGVTHLEMIIPNLAVAVSDTFPENKHEFEEHIELLGEDTVSSFHTSSEVFFKLYRPLESVDAWLDLLQQTYPQIVTIEVIGDTYEGRPYKVVHVSVPDSDIAHEEKKTIVITGGVHAREWISVSTTLYCLYELLVHYESSPDAWRELAKLDFLFTPVLNPDGYVYSWEHDRLWRKNRQPTDVEACTGIDIDHSFDFHWTKSSEPSCSEDYAGEHPFEAYEARIWDSYLNATNDKHKIYGYLDLHLYSQEILYPYAYSCEETPRDEENLLELAYGISKTIRLKSNKYYAVAPACLDRDSDLIPDLGAGTALDYMYHHKAYWAFQIKLRDSGSHGFLLPAKYIQPVGEEISAALKYFARFILSDE